MIHLLVAMMLSPTEVGLTQRFFIRDQATAAPVTDKDLRPARPADCKTEADVRRAVEQVRSGQPGDCWVRDASAFNRHDG